MTNIIATLNTGGDGLWSDKVSAVRIIRLEIEPEWNELRVYFHPDDWDVYEDGLIYTDHKFVLELQTFLRYLGLNGHVYYSEQGMQSDRYVSLDTSDKFVAKFLAKFNDVSVDIPPSFHAKDIETYPDNGF